MAGNFPASVQDINISLSPGNSSTNPVSWQTAFLGLVPLALNAMSQPSSLDFNLPESSLLFAARSSPFICVADALEVIIALCLYARQERNIYEAARLVNWRIARARLGRRVSELEANAMEKHPLIFSILFLVTLSQAIKFLGLQGLPWTKVWAGIYLCSYVVLAIVRALASKDWRDRPPRVVPLGENALFKEKLLGIIRIMLLVAANVVHASVSCWALSYTQYQYRWMYEESFGWIFAIIDASRIVFFLCIAVSLITLLPWVLFLYLMGGNLTWISFREQIVQRYIIDFKNEQNYMGLRRENDHFLMLQLMPVAVAVLLSCILYSLSWVFGNLFMTILRIIDGGLTLTLCFGLLFLLFTIMSAISKRVCFLSFLKIDDGDYKALLVFPFLNFLVALLYYRYVYDPTGTVKPSWTESLG